MIVKTTGRDTHRTIAADNQDEMDEAVEHWKQQGWHVVSTVRLPDGSYRCEMERE